MLPEIVRSSEQLLPADVLQEEISISSPFSQMMEFYDPGLFQNSDEVSSSVNNCCSFEDNNSPAGNFSFPPENKFFSGDCADATATTTANDDICSLSIIFDNDITASIDFSPTSTFSIPHDQTPFDFSSNDPQMPFPDPFVVEELPPSVDGVVPAMGGNPFPATFEDDHQLFSAFSAAMGSYMPAELTNSGVMAFNIAETVAGGFLMGSELQPELDYRVESCGSAFFSETQRFLGAGDGFQGVGNEGQQFVGGAAAAGSGSLTSEFSSLDDTISKAVKLSVEQRKEKIHRYLKKRNERNFSKKIKYACRKALADSRPRVRGRFAKNDEFGETLTRARTSNNEEEDEEVVGKEIEDYECMVDSSDIFAHITGVNSFDCNYPIHPWIGLN